MNVLRVRSDAKRCHDGVYSNTYLPMCREYELSGCVEKQHSMSAFFLNICRNGTKTNK